MKKMSLQRLGDAPIRVREFLTAGEARNTSIGHFVHLDLYRIDFDAEPILNPDYYTEGRWMDFDEYASAVAGSPCGLCVRLWTDHAYLLGLCSHPFLPAEQDSNV